ncbi:MAG: hypothetical protein KGJ06_06240 [Pseudomonadota bacterium]|nr:hypothetical protein [Pseudomonadota bacterium]
MATIKKLLSCHVGGVLILVAVMLPLLLMIVAAGVDIGRLYAVRGKAMTAADAALLGAVGTRSTQPVDVEMAALFNANYPANYLGSTVDGIAVSQPADGMYDATVTVTVPMLVMGIFGVATSTLTIDSQADAGYQITPGQSLELSLVFDNSAVMGGINIVAMQAAASAMTGIVFGSSASLSNVHVSLVPYDVAVNAGSGRAGWIQSAWAPSYTQFIANRNNDSPPNGLTDASDSAPVDDTTRFRVPSGNGNDLASSALAPLQFAMNSAGAINAALNAMEPAGHTRLNVGLMWGWFALSPNWQGLWDSAQPAIPAPFDPSVQKTLVLAAGSLDDVYTGDLASDDDSTALEICSAIKADGITIYTVGIGPNVNQVLLQSCASLPGYYFTASTAALLQTAFQTIADRINGATLRLQ